MLMLLAAGARIQNWQDSDLGRAGGVNTPVMVCCRVGAASILRILLTKLRSEDRQRERRQAALAGASVSAAAATTTTTGTATPSTVQQELQYVATIDGFNALHAAAEQNHAECIGVLHEFGVNLEWKTEDTNPIVAGATALQYAPACVVLLLCGVERGVGEFYLL